jgi:hypothetical protein
MDSFLRKGTIIMKFLFLCLLFLLSSCIDSDAVLSKNESEKIKVNAFIFNDNASNLKDTTIALKDTVFLIGNILPERGTLIQKYFWKDPDNNIFKEFQIKFKPTKPGNFVYHFTIVDFHGDSLSDSVQINVSTPPVLDSIHWLPENNSSRLSPDSIFFSWNASDKDKDNLFYIFEIFENNKKIIDTLLSTTCIKPDLKFKELETYEWKVTVFDSEGIQGNTISSEFATGHSKGLTRLSGKINIFPDSLLKKVKLYLVQNDSSKELTLNDSLFDTGFINSGDYTLRASVMTFSDYQSHEQTYHLKPGDLKDNINFLLEDNKAPSFLALKSDTLPYVSQLIFPIENHGIQLDSQNISLTLDNEPLQFSLSNDTLSIELPKYNLPICRFLSLKIKDINNNSISQTFYLCKESAWATPLYDTTLNQQDTLNISFYETNPYHLELKDIIWSSKENPAWTFTQTKSDSSITIYASLFSVGKYTIEALSRYENGLELQNQFILEVKE